MNILHHKSYHVYNKKNIEKVRKDEAEAEAKGKEKQDRVILAESEARLDLLRKKANAKLPTAARDQVEHVNLFKDLLVDSKTNKNEEHEAEVKEKDEKWERQITMYLDKGAKKEEEPWYAKIESEDQKFIDKYAFKRKEDKDSKRRKRDPIKLLEDPLDMITSRLKDREKKEKERKEKKYQDLDRESKSKNRSKHHRSKSKHDDKGASSSSVSLSVAELRAKRLERERNEQVRVKQLYLGPNIPNEDDEDEEEEELDDRKRGYNSQFNRDETNEAKISSRKRRR